MTWKKRSTNKSSSKRPALRTDSPNTPKGLKGNTQKRPKSVGSPNSKNNDVPRVFEYLLFVLRPVYCLHVATIIIRTALCSTSLIYPAFLDLRLTIPHFHFHFHFFVSGVTASADGADSVSSCC